MPGRPPSIAVIRHIMKAAYKPVSGLTWAITAKAIASGTRANATVRPDRMLFLARVGESFIGNLRQQRITPLRRLQRSVPWNTGSTATGAARGRKRAVAKATYTGGNSRTVARPRNRPRRIADARKASGGERRACGHAFRTVGFNLSAALGKGAGDRGRPCATACGREATKRTCARQASNRFCEHLQHGVGLVLTVQRTGDMPDAP